MAFTLQLTNVIFRAALFAGDAVSSSGRSKVRGSIYEGKDITMIIGQTLIFE